MEAEIGDSPGVEQAPAVDVPGRPDLDDARQEPTAEIEDGSPPDPVPEVPPATGESSGATEEKPEEPAEQVDLSASERAEEQVQEMLPVAAAEASEGVDPSAADEMTTIPLEGDREDRADSHGETFLEIPHGTSQPVSIPSALKVQTNNELVDLEPDYSINLTAATTAALPPRPVFLEDNENLQAVQEQLHQFDNPDIKVYRANKKPNRAQRTANRVKNSALEKGVDVLVGVKEAEKEGDAFQAMLEDSKKDQTGKRIIRTTRSATANYDDESQEVDIIGTLIKDANTAIQEEAQIGANTADSPLDNPFILMAAPVLPIGGLAAYTIIKAILPYATAGILAILSVLGWRFWVGSFVFSLIMLVMNWSNIQKVEALRPVTLQVDLAVLTTEKALHTQWKEAKPEIDKAIEKYWPRAELRKLDAQVQKILGYSLLDVMIARIWGWEYDGKIKELYLDEPADAGRSDELFFNIKINFEYLEEIHARYSSVWLEWVDGNMIAASTPERDVVKEGAVSSQYTDRGHWKGYGARLNLCSATHEVLIPYRFTDEGDRAALITDQNIRLVLKGRKDIVIYNNDGAPRFQKGVDQHVVIGEALVSAARIGVKDLWEADESVKVVKSKIRLPIRAPGSKSYRAAVLHCNAEVRLVDNTSYSYRDKVTSIPVGEWTVRVNVYEFRSLHVISSGGSSDPIAQVTLFGQKKSTKKVSNATSCVVDETLYFRKVVDSPAEFATEDIKIDVTDWGFFGNRPLGHLIMNLKSIYEMDHHELFREWFPLIVPTSMKVVNPFSANGFIKLSITVMPPKGIPKTHASIEDKEEYSRSTVLRNTIVRPPPLRVERWILHVKLGWADMLPRLTNESEEDVIRGFAVLSLTGRRRILSRTFIAKARDIIDTNLGSTTRVVTQRMVLFNEEFLFPFYVADGVENSERVQVSLYHRGKNNMNKLIGRIELSYKELSANLRTAVVRGDPKDKEAIGDRYKRVAMIKPSYYNFYGSAKGSLNVRKKAVSFRGRMLVSMAAKPGDIHEPISRPCKPLPRPQVDLYRIDFTILRATELSIPDGDYVRLEASIGPYTFGSSIPQQTVKGLCVSWREQNVLRMKNLQFPAELSQIPDLFITLETRRPNTSIYHEAKDSSDAEQSMEAYKPVAFLRIPAYHLILDHESPRWMFMDSVRTDSTPNENVPGSLLLSCKLTKTTLGMTYFAKERGDIETSVESETAENSFHGEVVTSENEAEIGNNAGGEEKFYTLKALCLQGRNLPAADQSGLSDPFVRVSMGERSKQGTASCKETVCPIWEEEIVVKNISIRENEKCPNVNILVYDHDDGPNYDYLGRAIIAGASLTDVEVDPKKAVWYDVFAFDPERTVGQILADFQLIPQEGLEEEPPEPQERQRLFDVESSTVLRMAFLGIRDVRFLRFAHGTLSLTATTPGDTEVTRQVEILQQHGIYDGAADLLDVRMLRVESVKDQRENNVNPPITFMVKAKYSLSVSRDEEVVGSTCFRLERDFLESAIPVPEVEKLTDWDKDFYEVKNIPSLERYELLSKRGVNWSQATLAHQGKRKLKLALRKMALEDALQPLETETINTDTREIDVGYERPDKDSMTVKQKIYFGLQLHHLERLIFVTIPYNLRLNQAKFDAARFQLADSIANVMPEVASRLGIEAGEVDDILITEPVGADENSVLYDTSILLKNRYGFCPGALEDDFNKSIFQEFKLFRGDSRAADSGLLLDSSGGADVGDKRVVLEERARTRLEGQRPVIGILKAQMLPVKINEDEHDQSELKDIIDNMRFKSLSNFASTMSPHEVVVRIYILRATNLQHGEGDCNPFLDVEVFGGYPKYFSTKREPIQKSSNPNFFETFESRVLMPGAAIRVGIRDRRMPELSFLTPRMLTREEGRWVRRPIPVDINLGKRGVGQSEDIGETLIDLDYRWYNSEFRALARPPVELRPLFTPNSDNLRGRLEVIVQMIDAKEYDSNPRDPFFRPLPVLLPPKRRFQVRMVVFGIEDAYNPMNIDKPELVSNYFIKLRLGNRREQERLTDTSRNAADGTGNFNERVMWWIDLPDPNIRPRMKLQIFDSKKGSDDLVAVTDIKLLKLFEEALNANHTVIRKKQDILAFHPDYPHVQAKISIALEIVPEGLVKEKKCNFGKQSWHTDQHEDYVLPKPFRPVGFSMWNPYAYIDYIIKATIMKTQWSLVMGLLVFPFIPVVFFVLGWIPWWWWLCGGISGSIVLARLVIVMMQKAPPPPAKLKEEKAFKDDIIVEEHVIEDEAVASKAIDPMLRGITPVSDLLEGKSQK
ncbi:hypothetical protein NDN08_005473 [Rhodosorus marinus]|uniref:C2 domain-containing protein n=1 Tax=Rhodosorus marinus TaxID=101924 RepID=A0AAV8V4G2_9RHOD|nr:hypothetical protein NDN08_005473 [Rhodosorus marinus]